MVFLVQHTQNVDAEAMQLKLDERLRAIRDANTAFVDIEELDPAGLDRLKHPFERLAAMARRQMDADEWAAHLERLEER